MDETKGYIQEIFSSFQGEGPYVGERHVFVRFSSCNLACAYCDTPGSRLNPAAALVEQGRGREVIMLKNPLSVVQTVRAVKAQDAFPGFNAAVCITGGEPLNQPRFLKELLVRLGGRLRTILETNGTLPDAFREVAGLVDVVSMDIKLPSVSGQGGLWGRHREFMEACRGRELVVKAVVGQSTPAAEARKAARLVSASAPGALFVLQPLTPPDGPAGAEGGRWLDALFEAAARNTARVRVIPQVHKFLKVK